MFTIVAKEIVRVLVSALGEAVGDGSFDISAFCHTDVGICAQHAVNINHVARAFEIDVLDFRVSIIVSNVVADNGRSFDVHLVVSTHINTATVRSARVTTIATNSGGAIHIQCSGVQVNASAADVGTVLFNVAIGECGFASRDIDTATVLLGRIVGNRAFADANIGRARAFKIYSTTHGLIVIVGQMVVCDGTV